MAIRRSPAARWPADHLDGAFNVAPDSWLSARELRELLGARPKIRVPIPLPRRFDRFVDGLNRLPRPMMALGVIGLFAAAMGDPDWFAARMAGIALVPEPLWWLLGAIVSFYFGARHQAKGQEFRRSVAETVSRAAQAGSGQDGNPALDSWRQDAAG